MRIPLETILTLPRVKLTRRVPIIEAEKLVKFYVDKPRYHSMLLKHTKKVTGQSYVYFCDDETSLLGLMAAVNSKDYAVSVKSQVVLSDLLTDVYDDSLTFKNFEENIEPLIDISSDLEEMTSLTDQKAYSTRRYAKDLGDLIGVKVPRENPLRN